MMTMVVAGLVGLFSIFSESQKLSHATKQRIEGIQIAREWIEAFENIRDTNWFLFSADLWNCWNTLNYNSSCFGDAWTTLDIQHNASYIITQDSDNRWILTEVTKTAANDEFSDVGYRNDFRVRKDNSGFYTQSWGVDFLPIFTRELLVEYIEDTTNPPDSIINENDEKIRVTSIVQWNDGTTATGKRIELQTELSNWKNYE